MDNEQTGAVESPEPLWKRRGFDSEDAMDKAFIATKEDLKNAKARARSFEEKAGKADEYERLQAEKAQAEMSELDKARQSLAELSSKVQSFEREIHSRDQALVYERLASSKLSGVPEAESKLLRRLYDAEALKGFETPEELKERLDAVDADWQASKPVKSDSPFTRPAAPGLVTPPPATGKPGQLDESKFEELGSRLNKPPARFKK